MRVVSTAPPLRVVIAAPLFLLTSFLLARATLALADEGLARPFRRHAPLINAATDPDAYKLSVGVYLGGSILIGAMGFCMLGWCIWYARTGARRAAGARRGVHGADDREG
jgi:hypothetical protein